MLVAERINMTQPCVTSPNVSQAASKEMSPAESWLQSWTQNFRGVSPGQRERIPSLDLLGTLLLIIKCPISASCHSNNNLPGALKGLRHQEESLASGTINTVHFARHEIKYFVRMKIKVQLQLAQ